MLTLIIIAIIITAIILLIPKSKNTLKKEQVVEEKPKHRIETHYVWLVDSQNVARFEKAYKPFYEENSDYFLPARELKDYYSYEKVYKFEPYELPLKMEKLDCLASIPTSGETTAESPQKATQGETLNGSAHRISPTK